MLFGRRCPARPATAHGWPTIPAGNDRGRGGIAVMASRRTVLFVVAAVASMTLSACGDAPTSTSPGDPPTGPPSTAPAPVTSAPVVILPDPAVAEREIKGATLSFAAWPKAGTLGKCRTDGVTFADGWSTNVDEPYTVRILSVTPAAIGGAPTYLVNALCHGRVTAWATRPSSWPTGSPRRAFTCSPPSP